MRPRHQVESFAFTGGELGKDRRDGRRPSDPEVEDAPRDSRPEDRLPVTSFAGMVIQLVGSATEADGFTDDVTSQSVLADIAWPTFSVGGLLALRTGIAAWARGRTSRWMFDVRAGQAAAAYVVIALLLMLLTG